MSDQKEIVVATQANGAVKVIYTGYDNNGLPRGSIVTETASGDRIVVGKDILLHALLSRQQDPEEWNILVGLDEIDMNIDLISNEEPSPEPEAELEAEPEEAESLAAAGRGPCWEGYKQVGFKMKNGKRVPNCVPKNASVVAELAASRRAPKKDRVYGSKKNKKGSASGGKKITFSAKTTKALQNKVAEHNKNASKGRKATLGQLKAVYRRGAGAFSSSHRPGKTRDQWAMARVNAYLKLLKSGRPKNPNYKQDNDLLPSAHPKSTRASAASVLTASLAQHVDESYVEGQLYVTLPSDDSYSSTEDVVFALAEYSGQGYEIIPAIRAAWLRGVESLEDPYNRAFTLATKLHGSRDADLLPKRDTL